jgi:hypothetical protein
MTLIGEFILNIFSRIIVSKIKSVCPAYLAAREDVKCDEIADASFTSHLINSRPSLPFYLSPFWRDIPVELCEMLQQFCLKDVLAELIELDVMRKKKTTAKRTNNSDTFISLLCPLSKTTHNNSNNNGSRIEHPSRGRNCKHDQCFDLEIYTLLGGPRAADFKCPVCHEPLVASDLMIDLQFLCLLETFPNSDKCILHSDGHASPYFT